MSRRILKDQRTPEQKKRDGAAARNRAWLELRQILPGVNSSMLNGRGERVEVAACTAQ
jgi:hypothetical protein